MLTTLFLSAVELIEAEGRELRGWTLRLGISIALVLVAATLLAAGVLVIVAGVFLILHRLIGPAPALIIVGLLILACAGSVLWKANNLINPPD